MKRLVLVRHGQSEWNAERRVQGQSGTGLSRLGAVQAVTTAEWLADAYPDARLVSSDLQRCKETMAPLAELLGREVQYDEAVRERSFGRWEGLLLTEIEAYDEERWARWCTGEDVLDEVDGESGEALSARTEAAFRSHAAELLDDGTVIVVTHGGPIWHGTTALLDVPFGTLGGVANTSITIIGFDGVRAWLEAWNQTAHLPSDQRTFFRESVRRQAPVVGR